LAASNGGIYWKRMFTSRGNVMPTKILSILLFNYETGEMFFRQIDLPSPTEIAKSGPQFVCELPLAKGVRPYILGITDKEEKVEP
jgi:hypothetical protein